MCDMNELKEAYKAFMVQGDSKATAMTGKNFVKCCKDCKVIDGKKVTTTDADIEFSKNKTKGAKTIDFEQFKACLVSMGKKRGLDADGVFNLVAGKRPGLKGVTKVATGNNVDRMTDTSQYTGAHKERFDKDGKGKGVDGRVDRVENDGYVGNYKNKGTYEEKVN